MRFSLTQRKMVCGGAARFAAYTSLLFEKLCFTRIDIRQCVAVLKPWTGPGLGPDVVWLVPPRQVMHEVRTVGM